MNKLDNNEEIIYNNTKNFFNEKLKDMIKNEFDGHEVWRVINDFIIPHKNKKNENIYYNSPLEKNFFFLFFLFNYYGYFKNYNLFFEANCKLYCQYPIDNKKYYIDYVLITPSKKIAIELDGYNYHDKDKKQFNYERKRQNEIVNQGFIFLRFTYDDIKNNFEKNVLEVIIKSIYKQQEKINNLSHNDEKNGKEDIPDFL